MAKTNTKQESVIDVLVLGEHPAGYLAAALLCQKTKLRVLHATIPGVDPDDRLVTINPAFFDLHPLLAPLRRKLNLTGLYGLHFLTDDAQTHSEYRDKSAIAFVGKYKSIREELAKIAAAEGVEFATLKQLVIHHLDETGLDVTVGKTTIRATALVLAGKLPQPQRDLLGVPDGQDREVLHRYTFIRCKNGKHVDLGSRPTMPMALDLCGQLCWGWLIPGAGEFQIAVEQPITATTDAISLMWEWIQILKRHGQLNAKFEFAPSAIHSFDFPPAGALAAEGVANRTLLIGPAGGFYSACAEDIYPNCWSAIYAADVLKKALREKHLQDALNPFRQKWRTTLGDYLRGPHQNLRFLLPLVYRNPVMTSRLAEAILLSKNVVR